MSKELNIPEEIISGVKVCNDKIYVLEAYRSHPLFLSFKKAYENLNGKISVSVVSAEELNTKENSKVKYIDENRIIGIYKKMFETAAEIKASDIHIVLIKESHTDIYFRIHGKLFRQNQLAYEEGNAIMRSIYQNISMSDVSYRDNEYQAGQIHSFDDAKSIPDIISSIRIQRGPILNGFYMALRLLYKDDIRHNTKKIGQILIADHLINEKTLNTALNIQQELKNKGQNVKIGDILVNNNFIARNKLEEVLFKQKGSLKTGMEIFKNYGYTEEQALILTKAARQPQGMVIFSGPTGAGKSTALKVALEFQAIMYPDKAIYTIEDPPEYPIIGAKQMPVLNANTEGKRESKFAECLRVAMRSDPDILMVGEVRDESTASVAMDAVITGHQMWTTVHSIDVFAIITRLLRFGLKEYDLLDEKLLNVLVNQRLLPRLCDNCKTSFNPDLLDIDIANTLEPFRDAVKLRNDTGCEKCNHTGITGRVIVAEVLEVTEELVEGIKNYGLAAERRKFLNSYTIMKHAINRIVHGEVDPRDVVSLVGNIKLDEELYV